MQELEHVRGNTLVKAILQILILVHKFHKGSNVDRQTPLSEMPMIFVSWINLKEVLTIYVFVLFGLSIVWTR
jgi:hypothetical protein